MGVGYRSFGMLWCAGCHQKREFIALDESCKDANEAECCECGYRFGMYNDEKTLSEDGEKFITTTHPVLDPKRVEQARMDRLKDYRRTMLQSGVRLERLNGRAKSRTTDV